MNQCDGCRAGRPKGSNGYHRMGDAGYPDFMKCQADKYGIQPEQAIQRAVEILDQYGALWYLVDEEGEDRPAELRKLAEMLRAVLT